MCTAPARNAGLDRIRRCKGQRGLHPLDPVSLQRIRQPVQRVVPIPAGRDDLREKRIVVDGDHAPRLDTALVAEPRPFRQLEGRDGSRETAGSLGPGPRRRSGTRPPRPAPRCPPGSSRAAPRRRSGTGPRRGPARRPPPLRDAPPGAGRSSRESRTGPPRRGTRRSPRSGTRPRPPRARPPRGGALEGPASRPGAGDSSTSFWWRRWIEQSRSKRWTSAPCSSPRTWTSTCRGRSTARST